MSAARILVVEDNPSDIYVLRHCLNELREAYDLQVVPDGESALEFIQKQRDNPEDARKLLRVGNAPVPSDAPEPELAAWANVCRVVLNLHETITRY